MTQLASNEARSVVEKMTIEELSENGILVENKSEQFSEENIVEKDEGRKKNNFNLTFWKSNKPSVPPKIAKTKTAVEDVPKYKSEKLDEKIARNQNTPDDARTEETDRTATAVEILQEKMPQLEILSNAQITVPQDGTESHSENEMPKEASTEPQVVASTTSENPTGLQVEPSSMTSATLPTPAKQENGWANGRKHTRTLSQTNLSRKSSVLSSTSRSSLGVSAGPSSSSMCHLTELSQPSTVHLQSTLAQLRRINAKTERVQQHLKDLRNRPTLALRAKKSSSDTKLNRSSRNTGSKSLPSGKKISSLSVTSNECGLLERPVYEKLADRLFETLESKLAVKNSAQQLMLPMESDYYRAAYAGLARIWGQPYTKCSLELHQHLAAELGLLAEAFVMDSTCGMSMDKLQ